MENDQRIITAISRLESAISSLEVLPLTAFQIKKAKSSVKSAITLLRNTKSNIRLEKIEMDIELLKETMKVR